MCTAQSGSTRHEEILYTGIVYKRNTNNKALTIIAQIVCFVYFWSVYRQIFMYTLKHTLCFKNLFLICLHIISLHYNKSKLYNKSKSLHFRQLSKCVHQFIVKLTRSLIWACLKLYHTYHILYILIRLTHF